MARYITLLRFTETGAKNLKKSTDRAHAFNQAAKKSGVTIEGQFWTMGAYDGVLIINADSEEKALHCLTELAAHGAVRTETQQAFTDKEFDAIIGR
ncbi:MAG: GYD domain-containing protein [Limisphaerales bacterium]